MRISSINFYGKELSTLALKSILNLYPKNQMIIAKELCLDGEKVSYTYLCLGGEIINKVI